MAQKKNVSLFRLSDNERSSKRREIGVNIDLLSITTEPAVTASGKYYYNSSTHKVYESVNNNGIYIFSIIHDPMPGVVYVFSGKNYMWSGSALFEVGTGGGGGGTESVFPSNSITSQTLLGLPSGSDISGKNAVDVLSDILMAELWPTLTAPSATFTISPSAAYQKVGAVISVTKTKTFSRGSISPAYGPTGAIDSAYSYRSGLLIDYTETNPANYTDGQNYTVVLGAQNWTCKANYQIGVQPHGSKGTNYQSPLPAGSTSIITRTITGVYPVLATTSAIDTLTEQALQAHGSDIIVALVTESGSNKQTVQIPVAWGNITTLQQYNTLSGQYDTIDINTFTKTSVTISGVNYYQYTYNGSLIGARTLKFKL